MNLEQSKLQRTKILEDAIKFLDSKPGTTTKHFVTFSDVRSKTGAISRTRESLRTEIMDMLNKGV